MDGRFTRRQLIKGGLAVAAVPLLPAVASAAHRVDVPALPWPAANDIVANTTIPMFPDRRFPVADYGAEERRQDRQHRGHRQGDHRRATRPAAGTWSCRPAAAYVTGAIYLKSNVDLHLETPARCSSSAATPRSSRTC